MANALAEKSAASHSPGSGAIRLPLHIPKEVSQYRRHWWFQAPAEATREDPLHPSFWANVCKHFRRHDLITLLANDEGWELELCVEAVRQSGADVSVRKNYSRSGMDRAGTPVGSEHRTEYRGTDGWCIVRVKDGHPIIRGHTLEVSAINQFHREQPKAA
jgi:hypothetical protein